MTKFCKNFSLSGLAYLLTAVFAFAQAELMTNIVGEASNKGGKLSYTIPLDFPAKPT